MSHQMEKTYDHSVVENRLYETWEKNGYFHAKPNPNKPPYCIVIPPPNITLWTRPFRMYSSATNA